MPSLPQTLSSFKTTASAYVSRPNTQTHRRSQFFRRHTTHTLAYTPRSVRRPRRLLLSLSLRLGLPPPPLSPTPFCRKENAARAGERGTLSPAPPVAGHGRTIAVRVAAGERRVPRLARRARRSFFGCCSLLFFNPLLLSPPNLHSTSFSAPRAKHKHKQSYKHRHITTMADKKTAQQVADDAKAGAQKLAGDAAAAAEGAGDKAQGALAAAGEKVGAALQACSEGVQSAASTAASKCREAGQEASALLRGERGQGAQAAAILAAVAVAAVAAVVGSQQRSGRGLRWAR